MKTRRSLSLLLSAAALFGCSSEPATGDDGGVTPGTDAHVVPGTDADVPGTDGSGPPAGWHAIELPGEDEERVTGMICNAANDCTIAASAFIGDSHLYATDGATITATLLTGDDALGEMVGVLGEPQFLGFTRIGTTTIALLDKGSSGLISTTGDFTEASWTVSRLGTSEGESFGLNAQYGFGTDGTNWLQFRNGLIYGTTDGLVAGADWDVIWSPQRVPPVPADIDALRAADPTICSSDPGLSNATRPNQSAYVATDLSLILSPANGLNQDSDDVTGVCISTDGGHMFHLAPLADVADTYGPTALHCTSSTHCVVAGGQEFADAVSSAYVYVSSDASAGAASHWTRATVPPFEEDATLLHYIFFAPDGVHGWIAGEEDNRALLWATTDGGSTWTDVTVMVRALSDEPLWSGIAIDATHLLVGGEGSTLLASY